MKKPWRYLSECCASGGPAAKTLRACGPSGFGLGTSIGTPFTMVPPRHFQKMTQYTTLHYNINYNVQIVYTLLYTFLYNVLYTVLKSYCKTTSKWLAYFLSKTTFLIFLLVHYF